ncbi:hypothetical protein, partial [Bacillus thuringiensis]|uniref:hypothetical protein n=1 Tax=Bacillus thuringiensis TaxID=1428 RepID=UPI0018D101DD
MSYWIVTLGNLYFVGETMRNYGEMDLLFTANKEIALPLETKNDVIKRSQEFKNLFKIFSIKLPHLPISNSVYYFQVFVHNSSTV